MGRWSSFGLSNLIDFRFDHSSSNGHHNNGQEQHGIFGSGLVGIGMIGGGVGGLGNKSKSSSYKSVTTKYHKLDDSVFVLCRNYDYDHYNNLNNNNKVDTGPSSTTIVKKMVTVGGGRNGGRSPKHFFTWSASAANNKLQKMSKSLATNFTRLQMKMEKAIPFQQGLNLSASSSSRTCDHGHEHGSCDDCYANTIVQNDYGICDIHTGDDDEGDDDGDRCPDKIIKNVPKTVHAPSLHSYSPPVSSSLKNNPATSSSSTPPSLATGSASASSSGDSSNIKSGCKNGEVKLINTMPFEHETIRGDDDDGGVAANGRYHLPQQQPFLHSHHNNFSSNHHRVNDSRIIQSARIVQSHPSVSQSHSRLLHQQHHHYQCNPSDGANRNRGSVANPDKIIQIDIGSYRAYTADHLFEMDPDMMKPKSPKHRHGVVKNCSKNSDKKVTSESGCSMDQFFNRLDDANCLDGDIIIDVSTNEPRSLKHITTTPEKEPHRMGMKESESDKIIMDFFYDSGTASANTSLVSSRSGGSRGSTGSLSSSSIKELSSPPTTAKSSSLPPPATTNNGHPHGNHLDDMTHWSRAVQLPNEEEEDDDDNDFLLHHDSKNPATTTSTPITNAAPTATSFSSTPNLNSSSPSTNTKTASQCDNNTRRGRQGLSLSSSTSAIANNNDGNCRHRTGSNGRNDKNNQTHHHTNSTMSTVVLKEHNRRGAAAMTPKTRDSSALSNNSLSYSISTTTSTTDDTTSLLIDQTKNVCTTSRSIGSTVRFSRKKAVEIFNVKNFRKGILRKHNNSNNKTRSRPNNSSSTSSSTTSSSSSPNNCTNNSSSALKLKSLRGKYPPTKLAVTTFEKEEELRHAPWFQAGIPRELALEILRNEPVGCFIVRESTTKSGCFALSLRVPSDYLPCGIAHYLILKTNRGYKFKGFTKEFGSLSSLITHHSVMSELLPCPLSLHRYESEEESLVKKRVSRANSNDFMDPEKLVIGTFTDF